MGCTSYWNHSVTGCRIQLFLLCQLGTFHSQCTMHITFARIKRGFFYFYHFHLSFHHTLYAKTCTFCSIISSYDFIHTIQNACCMYGSSTIHDPPFQPDLGAPPPILVISGNIFSRYIDSPEFNIVKSLNITLVGVLYFIIGAGLGSVTYFYLE